MKIRILTLFTAFILPLCTAFAQTSDLLLGAGGKTMHRIVIPDSFPIPEIETSVKQAAELLQRAFTTNDIPIEILSESQLTDNSPAIYLGQTEFARKNGVDFESLEGWTCIFKAVGRNLMIVGNDRPDPIPLEKRRRREAVHGGMPWLGTLKATTEFCYRYAGVRFLNSEWHGVEFLPTPVIYVPGDLNVTWRPFGRDIEIARSKDLTTIANGFEPSPKVLSNWGHYHYSAISPKEYGESNPEYFILKGTRRENRNDHLCFSNPDVPELIYRSLLKDFDTGYDIVELGQNDGFQPCQCEACFNLYGVQPTTTPRDGLAYLRDPAWGIKLWHMHREMAVRLLKDRPSKKLMITAYSVTWRPPEGIADMPENVIVQMAPPSEEGFELWKNVAVPGGYAAYLYTWGALTPKNTRFFIADQVRILVKNKAALSQVNLKERGMGLEGPNVYIFRRLLNDPDYATAEELFEEYIDACYREATGFMRRFFISLQERVRFYYMLEDMSHKLRNPLIPFEGMYSADMINELDALLQKAEAVDLAPAARARLAATRYEFDYLRHIVRVQTMHRANLLNPLAVPREKVIDTVEERNAWLDSVKPPRPSWTWYRTDQLKIPRWPNLNVQPFNWDTVKMREDLASGAGDLLAPPSFVVKKTSQSPGLEAEVWNGAASGKLRAITGAKGEVKAETSFKLLYDDEALYIRFEAALPHNLMDTYSPRGRDEELWLQECMNILLSPSGDKSQYYYLTYEPVADSWIDANHGFIQDPLHPKFGWNDQTWDGEWNYDNKMYPDRDVWLSMATVPFSTLATGTPASGEVWAANFGRVHYLAPITDASYSALVANREMTSWTGEFPGSRNPGDASMGDLTFE